MNLVELELDETLADFEVQDWIDNVFSVQYPDIKARIKKGCSGLCHKKNEWHSPDEHIDKDEVVLGIINQCNKLRYSLVQWNGHEVEIKIKQSGKKCVVEKNICVVSAIRDKE